MEEKEGKLVEQKKNKNKKTESFKKYDTLHANGWHITG